MKLIQFILAFFCLVFFGGQVFAQQESQPAIRIFQKTFLEEGLWEGYLSKLDEDDRKSKVLPIYKLAEQAYFGAKSNGYLEYVPVTLRSPELYQAIFIIINGFANQDKISFADLRNRGTSSGLYLPDMRMFVNESGDGFEAFKTKIARSIKTDDKGVETVPTSILGVLSFLRNKDTSYMLLVSENLWNQSSNIAAFTSYNELPATITLDEFKRLGQTEGLWVPVEVKYLEAFAKAFKDRTAALVDKETLLKNTAETNKVVQTLQAEISSLKKSKSADGAQAKKISELDKKLKYLETTLLKKIDVLSTEQIDAIKKQLESLSKIGQSLDGIEEKIVGINEIEINLAGITLRVDGVVSKTESMDKTIENIAKLVDYNQKAIIGLGTITVLILALMFFVRRNDKKDFKQKLATTNEAVEDMRQELSFASFDRESVTKEKVNSLEVGGVITLPINISDETFKVTITRISEEEIRVTGIRRHENDTSGIHSFKIGTDLPKMIEKAARSGHLIEHQEFKAVA